VNPSTGDWPERLMLTLAVLVVIGLVCWGMWRGWHNRAARQADLAEPARPPASHSESTPLATAAGRYIGTVRDGDWLDRIVAHGLGAPGRARIAVTDAGVEFIREGEDDLFIPRSDLRGASSGKGIAGEVVERGGLGIITWRLGDTALATGFRADVAADQMAVLKAVESLLADVSAGGAAS